MKNLPLCLALAILSCASCATIVSKTKYPIRIESLPEKASVIVTDRKGKEVYAGLTPAIITLRSGAGFFQKAIYTITFNKAGFKERTIDVSATLNGWYFGNILFGGFLGFLIVDPATGAMYRINEVAVAETLEETKDVSLQQHSLTIRDINTIPESWKKKLIKL
ncbi:MAG TPA: hypothetical protein VM010_03160 [Chitinophagaceae bacterium]|nr:hypothetical protein [Chitinophagaceae bacterium]